MSTERITRCDRCGKECTNHHVEITVRGFGKVAREEGWEYVCRDFCCDCMRPLKKVFK